MFYWCRTASSSCYVVDCHQMCGVTGKDTQGQASVIKNADKPEAGFLLCTQCSSNVEGCSHLLRPRVLKLAQIFGLIISHDVTLQDQDRDMS